VMGASEGNDARRKCERRQSNQSVLDIRHGASPRCASVPFT
jgi:hypothetical protein